MQDSPWGDIHIPTDYNHIKSGRQCGLVGNPPTYREDGGRSESLGLQAFFGSSKKALWGSL